MVRFVAFLGGKQADESLLRQYLGVRGEWVAREFKRADQPSVFGLRIAVGAFANTEGGDVFLGVENCGEPTGTPVDPAEISKTLRQEGAPTRSDCITDLVKVVSEPLRISLQTGLPVFWLDVAAQGLLVGVLKGDRTLGLYDRPGAESEEIRGFEAVDLARKKTRARLLVRIYVEARRIAHDFTWVYQGPNVVREDTVQPLRAIIESEAWLELATPDDRSLTNSSYLGKFLSLPADYASWEHLRYNEQGQRLIARKNDLDQAVVNLRRYLEQLRIVPPD